MSEKAIKFYEELQAKPECPFCGMLCKSLIGLDTHFQRTHKRRLKDWLAEVNPNHCRSCGNQITGKSADVYKANACSHSCSMAGEFNSRYGAEISEETREKIGKVNRGRKKPEEFGRRHSEWMTKNGHPMKGKKHSKQSRLNMSAGQRKRLGASWEGSFSEFCASLRKSLYYKWTFLVLERDSFTCQCCDADRDLAAHHKESFRDLVADVLRVNPHLDLKNPDDRWELHSLCLECPPLLDLNNGITLCHDCHRGEHRGRKIKRIISIDQVYREPKEASRLVA